MKDKEDLYNKEAEQYVLGCLIFDSNSFSDIQDILTENSFYLPIHNEIFKNIKQLFDSGIICDYITITNKLKKSGKLEEIGDVAYLSELMANVATVYNIIPNAFEVKELAYKRIASEISARITRESKNYQSDIEDILSLVDELQVKFSNEISTLSGSQLKESEVTLSQKIGYEPHFLSLKQSEKMYGLFSKNNLSAIIGKAKSRKTFLATKFVSVLCNGGWHDEFIWSKKCKIAYFDTEQSRYHIQKIINRVCHTLMAESQPENFRIYALKQYDVIQRKKIIETIIKKDRPDVIFIDGIRDLILDFNDLREASHLINWLMKMIDKYNCHICSIIHTNKADSNARGHLGTEIVNKCELVIDVEIDSSDETKSNVTAKVSREEKFNPFSIEIVEGIPIAINEHKNNEPKSKNLPF